MIFLDRDRRDEEGRPIRPDQDWLDLAAAARRDALREAEEHEARPEVYGHDQVRAALEALFHDKCAYCETKSSAGFDWNVEHFRPKGKVAERADHPGYYWLAYEWSNLYPSCSHCNQRRRDRPRWGDLRYAGAGGKMDQFPLKEESSRALAPADDLDAERRTRVEEVIDLLKIIREQQKEGGTEAARDLKAFLDRWYLADSCEHAAAARAVVRDPTLFGL